MKTLIYRWGPALLFMALIFIASATPGTEIPSFGYWDILAKKGGHLCGYALLAAAYYRALGSKRISGLQFILALFLAVLYACSDEFHQRFTPGRTASFIDIGIDTVGSLIGITLMHFALKVLPHQIGI